MTVPTKMSDLFTIAASNSPAGSDAIGNSLDDYLRAGFAIIRSTNAQASASIASASTTDIGAADGEFVTITGTTTITSLGTTASGIRRACYFTGAAQITASTSIVLPDGANYTTTAGDVLVFRSMGSGVWRLEGASRAVKAALATNATSADKADKWTTARNFTLSGPVTGTASVDGSANVTLATAIADGALSIAKTSGLQTALDGKVDANGGTFTGSPIVQTGSVSNDLYLNKANTDGYQNRILGRRNGNNRWGIILGDASSETGSNAGSGFAIPRYNDAGSFQANSMTIDRSSGAMTIEGPLTIGSGKKITKLTVSTSAPGTLTDGELYLQF